VLNVQFGGTASGGTATFASTLPTNTFSGNTATATPTPTNANNYYGNCYRANTNIIITGSCS
jgi:hypothetical protein